MPIFDEIHPELHLMILVYIVTLLASHYGPYNVCTSTAYEGGETPHLCLALKWEPFWMGLQPQHQQCAIGSPLGGTQNSRQLPKAKAWMLIATVK